MVLPSEGLKPTEPGLPEGSVCGNCRWFEGIKEKHHAEGQCRFNPPIVFPNPIRKPITNEVVMSQIHFIPMVIADFFCGRFEKRIDI